jgi:cation:H+ antiporter
VALVGGAELLVRGAAALAARLHVTPLVIGLTVVAFGTSSPELAVSVQAAWKDQADIAVGNVVGSNIFNVLFILGMAALLAPLTVASRLVRLDVPLMIGVSLLMWAVSYDGQIGRFDGLLLLFGLFSYTAWCVRAGRTEKPEVEAEFAQEYGAPPRGAWQSLFAQIACVAVGLAFLGAGSNWFVSGAVDLATRWGMDELVIGLTIVAAGTSLPEAATSVLASLRGERDIAVGNIVGSNIFNILGVLGAAAALSPAGVGVSEGAMRLDIPVMIAVAVACLPIFFTGHTIARWEGLLFLGYYVAYTAYLVLSATGSTHARSVATILYGFALPLTAATLAVTSYRALRARGPAADVR